MKLSQEGETLLANIGSLTDQLAQLQQNEGFDEDPELTDLPEEGPGLAAIFAKLVDGQPLGPGEVEQLEEGMEGSGELVEGLIAKLVSGETLTPEELVILRAAIDGEGEEVAEGEAIAKAVIAGSLAGVNRQDAVPLLSGIAGLNRAGRLVTKRFSDWEAARADTSQDRDLVSLFSPGPEGRRVAKDLPSSLSPGRPGSRLGDGQEPEEDELLDMKLLERAVQKVVDGEALSQAEMMELLAANAKGRPLSLVADMPVHKTLRAFNRTPPIESLQATMHELKAMIGAEREDIILNRQGRGGKRRDLVHKSLAGALGHLFGQRE